MGGGRRSCMGHLRSSSPVPLFAPQVRLQSVHLPAFAALPCRGRAKVYISAGNHSTACVRSCDIVTTPVIRVLPCSCNNLGSYPNPPSYPPLRSGREGVLKKEIEWPHKTVRPRFVIYSLVCFKTPTFETLFSTANISDKN